MKYETQVRVEGYNKPSTYIISPPHLDLAILISGPNRTYTLTTPLLSPKILEGYSPQYVMTHLDRYTQIIQASNHLEQIILEVAEPLVLNVFRKFFFLIPLSGVFKIPFN